MRPFFYYGEWLPGEAREQTPQTQFVVRHVTELFVISKLIPFLLDMGLISYPHSLYGSVPVSLAAPADADNYGIGWTDLFASATVDTIGRPMRQALSI